MSSHASNHASSIPCQAALSAVLIRRDGTRKDYGNVSSRSFQLARHSTLVTVLVLLGIIALAVSILGTLAAFGITLKSILSIFILFPLVGLVTTAGVNFMAVDFTAGLASPRISSFNFHDSGTGTTAAAIGDTILQTQAGPATRATGTQSNPVAGQYRTVGTITYAGSLAITEWGAFNQSAQGGTLWDHRVFGAINVISGDSIQFTYTLTVNAGGT